jgi:predicted nucleic acid-binding protein
MSGAKAFFDTNVLLYMHSTADLGKQVRAQELFAECTRGGTILLSTQVVQEFFVVGLRKLALPKRVLQLVTSGFLELPIVVLGPTHIVRAIHEEERYHISFWDALILAAAEAGGAEVLYTEDLNDGQRYGNVLVQNPFRVPAN